jgi:hypothetical protein
MADAGSVVFPLSGYSATGGVLTFINDDQAVVALIETTSGGASRRLKVTEELIGSYLEDDYGVRPLRWTSRTRTHVS